MLPVSLSRQSPPPSPKMASPSSPSPKMASPSSPSPKMASPSSLSPTTVSRIGAQDPVISDQPVSDPSFAELPTDVLGLIMSSLVLKDNIRASAVCKSWCGAAVSVRVVEKYPLLMYFPKRGNLFELRDPLQQKTYTLDLPELARSTVCYAKDGWPLMLKQGWRLFMRLFFFNPFTREMVTLPNIYEAFDKVAFSCPPTSDKCVLVALNFLHGHVKVSTCHPGATEWTTESFPSFLRLFRNQSNLVYREDRFYTFNAKGTLYSFHPSSRTWNHRCADRLVCPYIYDREKYGWNEKSVALIEKKGELCHEISRTHLDGMTIFVSYYNAELRTNLLHAWMRNNVYFSRYNKNRQRCVTYSYDERSYNPSNEWQRWRELCPQKTIWIDQPPENV
ncbi:hypothetical protein CARUB_v10003152mg [Capsella rubella]|uniref:Uncharacterized protein n=1 Tax=Capsella rubella TaxID=81985 RepID=R0H6X1_9BRAS|nr:hypothetical protein CARUB_v10003152mg [Capsella rubella]